VLRRVSRDISSCHNPVNVYVYMSTSKHVTKWGRFVQLCFFISLVCYVIYFSSHCCLDILHLCFQVALFKFNTSFVCYSSQVLLVFEKMSLYYIFSRQQWQWRWQWHHHHQQQQQQQHQQQQQQQKYDKKISLYICCYTVYIHSNIVIHLYFYYIIENLTTDTSQQEFKIAVSRMLTTCSSIKAGE
jgi:hypothetical protein